MHLCWALTYFLTAYKNFSNFWPVVHIDSVSKILWRCQWSLCQDILWMKRCKTNPCEVADVQSDSFSSVGVDDVRWSSFGALIASGCRKVIQVISVLRCVPVVGRWRDDIIIQVNLLMGRIIWFLYKGMAYISKIWQKLNHEQILTNIVINQA